MIVATREYQCSTSRQIVPVEYLCDGIDDCLDGDDEVNPLCAGMLIILTIQSPSE